MENAIGFGASVNLVIVEAALIMNHPTEGGDPVISLEMSLSTIAKLGIGSADENGPLKIGNGE